MTVSELREILAKAEAQHGPDMPILLCFEETAMMRVMKRLPLKASAMCELWKIGLFLARA